MKITVYNRQTIENMEMPNVFHLIISIADPKGTFANIKTNEYTCYVLQLRFHDIDTVVKDYNDHLEPEMFQVSDAQNILQLIKVYGEAQEIIVQCEAGLSRSPGVAAALSKIINGTDSYYFKHHSGLNRRVYKMIIDSYYGPIVQDNNES